MRNVRVLALLAALLLVLAACNGEDDAAPDEPEAEEDAAADGEAEAEGAEDGEAVSVALVPKALDQEFWFAVEDGAEDAAGEIDGVDLTIQAPSSELAIDEQISIVEDLLVQGIDALVIAPTAPDQLTPVLTQASQEIPVLLVDTDIPEWDDKLTYIGTDNVEGGRVAAEYIIDEVGSGQLALIGGIPGATTGEDRLEGVREVIEGSDIEIVTEVSADWDRAEAVSAMEDILQANPDIDAVFAANDQMALGALEVLSARDMADDIVLVGFDGTPEAVENISEEGGIDASVAQNPYNMGYVGVEEGAAAARGGDVEERIDTGVTLITVENAEEHL